MTFPADDNDGLRAEYDLAASGRHLERIPYPDANHIADSLGNNDLIFLFDGDDHHDGVEFYG